MGQDAVRGLRASHHIDINRRTHRIEQMGSNQPIEITAEYEGECRDCGEYFASVSWDDMQDWARAHVGIVTNMRVDYAVVARAQQDNIERLLEP